MPQKGGGGGNKKAVEKKKAKLVEDKTFGLKNKNKSKKVQAFVKAVETSVSQAGIAASERRLAERAKANKEAMKAAKEAAEMEKDALFRTVVNKTVVPVGVDPKSVVCEFFKAGKCVRGNKCKYSHDVAVARKAVKRDMYTDSRDAEQADTIDKWDTAKLEEVVSKKLKGKLPATDIICKYFLDAIENSQYGWFWECVNGADCHYRHCLPPGYVLKTKADKEREKEQGENDEEETLEEKIDAQRKALDLSKCTPLTLELFMKWKADKQARRDAEVEIKRKDAEKKSAGSGLGVMSGRDLFRYDPSLFVDDDEADDEAYEVDEEYDPANPHNDGEDDFNAKNYDSQAESEEGDEEDGEEEEEDGDEDDDGEHDGEEGGEEDEEEEEQKESDKTKKAAGASSSSSVAKAAEAIDKSLFIDDEDVPDE